MSRCLKYELKYVKDLIPVTVEKLYSNWNDSEVIRKFYELMKPFIDLGYKLAIEDDFKIKNYQQGIVLSIVSSTDHNLNAFTIVLNLKYNSVTKKFCGNVVTDSCYTWTRIENNLVCRSKIGKNIFKKYLNYCYGYHSDIYFSELNIEDTTKFAGYLKNNMFKRIQNNEIEQKKNIIEKQKFKIYEDDIRYFIKSVNEVIEPFNAKCHLSLDSENPEYRVWINNNKEIDDAPNERKYGLINKGKVELIEWLTSSSNLDNMEIKFRRFEDKWNINLTYYLSLNCQLVFNNIGWKDQCFENIEDAAEYFINNFKKSHEMYVKIQNVIGDYRLPGR